MFCDHISYIIFGGFSYLNLIGRFAFPIFAFQTTEGYKHTKNLKKYIIKLFIFACISQIPYMLFLSTVTSNIFSLNVLFTFILGLLSILLYNKSSNKFLGFIFVVILGSIAQLIKADYGLFGVMLIFVFYIFKNKKIYMVLSAIILIILQYIIYIIQHSSSIFYYCLLMIFTCLSLIFICFYNKKEGPKEKYLFYIFYPLHLLILYFVWLLGLR